MTYHTVGHTLDVANICNHYIDYYMVADSVAELIRIAAIGHDYGYIYGPQEHEEKSIVELQAKLQGTYSKKQIEVINGMIRATKVPQRPQNIYEEILADADLDYLGRSDMIPVSNTLYKELKEQDKIGTFNDWNKLQVKFITGHSYFTKTAQSLREVNKQKQIERIFLLKEYMQKPRYF